LPFQLEENPENFSTTKIISSNSRLRNKKYLTENRFIGSDIFRIFKALAIKPISQQLLFHQSNYAVVVF